MRQAVKAINTSHSFKYIDAQQYIYHTVAFFTFIYIYIYIYIYRLTEASVKFSRQKHAVFTYRLFLERSTEEMGWWQLRSGASSCTKTGV